MAGSSELMADVSPEYLNIKGELRDVIREIRKLRKKLKTSNTGFILAAGLTDVRVPGTFS